MPADATASFILESWNGQHGWRFMFWAEAIPAESAIARTAADRVRLVNRSRRLNNTLRVGPLHINTPTMAFLPETERQQGGRVGWEIVRLQAHPGKRERDDL